MEERKEKLGHQRILLTAYLAHLAVPLVLLVDVLLAWGLGYVAFRPWASDTVLLTVSIAWLVAGLSALFLGRHRAKFLQRARGPLTSIYALYFCVFLFEVFARVALPPPNPMPALRPPGTKVTHETNSTQMPGIQGEKAFSVNELGFRGPSFPQPTGVYKIVTIGGSTTECAALDDAEEWPHLVMEELNQQQKKYPVWVANASVSGHNAVHHLVLLQALPILRKMNLLIFLIGVNELGPTLAFEGAPTESHLERDAAVFHEYLLAGASPRYQFPLYKRLELFRLGKKAGTALAQRFQRESRQQEWLDLRGVRKRRAEAKILPLPDLQIGLQEYRERVLGLAQECKVLQVRCLFLTQPSLWRSDLTPQEQQLLWWGDIGRWEKPKGYASAADLAKAMDAYNRTLLRVCQQSGLECYDLAFVVPKNSSAFYDDQHFNEEGARIVAQHLADYLLSKPPFAGVSRPTDPNKP